MITEWLYARCIHRSHRLRLRCLRSWTYDGYCRIHNSSCFSDNDCAYIKRVVAKMLKGAA